MARTRRRFDRGFKAKVALEAVRGLRTISEIAQQFKVHPNQVTLWKKQLLSGVDQVFEGSGSKTMKSDEPEAAELYEQIGRLKVELEWLKKKSPRTREECLIWIDRDHESLSVRRQCELLGVHRSKLYYEPVPETDENLELMRLLDEQCLKTPFWGSRNMTFFLRKRGHPVNRKRTQCLLRKMGLEGAVAHDWWTLESFMRMYSGDKNVKVKEASSSDVYGRVQARHGQSCCEAGLLFCGGGRSRWRRGQKRARVA